MRKYASEGEMGSGLGRPPRSADPRVRNGRKMGHRLHSRRNPEGFLRSSRLKSCFGEHDFSQDFALPGRKSLRSGKQSPREALSLRPAPARPLPPTLKKTRARDQNPTSRAPIPYYSNFLTNYLKKSPPQPAYPSPASSAPDSPQRPPRTAASPRTPSRPA